MRGTLLCGHLLTFLQSFSSAAIFYLLVKVRSNEIFVDSKYPVGVKVQRTEIELQERLTGINFVKLKDKEIRHFLIYSTYIFYYQLI